MAVHFAAVFVVYDVEIDFNLPRTSQYLKNAYFLVVM